MHGSQHICAVQCPLQSSPSACCCLWLAAGMSLQCAINLWVLQAQHPANDCAAVMQRVRASLGGRAQAQTLAGPLAATMASSHSGELALPACTQHCLGELPEEQRAPHLKSTCPVPAAYYWTVRTL